MIGGHGRPAATRPRGLPPGGGAPAVDPRLVAALTAQLERWRATLAAGATRVGWKLGVGDAERIGDELAVGHLTSATLLAPGAAYAAGEAAGLHADAEVAFEIGPAPVTASSPARSSRSRSVPATGSPPTSAPWAGSS